MRYGLLVGLLIVFVGFSINTARGADTDPQVFMTWRAEALAPADYPGKILPTGSSRISVFFDVIDNGVVQNLSQQTIYWYLNNKLIKKGGQNLIIRAPDVAGGFLNIRVQLPDYRGKLLVKTLTVPLVLPDIVIEAPYSRSALRGSEFTFRAQPYFFSTRDPKDFEYTWRVNGSRISIEGDPQQLNLRLESTPPENTLRISVSAKSPFRDFENTTRTTTFILAP